MVIQFNSIQFNPIQSNCRPMNCTMSALLQASKSALAQMTETLRIELDPFGIQVTSIIPGWVQTNIMTNNDTKYKQ
jgi:short-subunit dehydrogenase